MVDRAAWPAPPISGLIQGAGGIADPEMFATFNMGIGMIAVVGRTGAAAARALLESHGHLTYEIGMIEPSDAGGPTIRLA